MGIRWRSLFCLRYQTDLSGRHHELGPGPAGLSGGGASGYLLKTSEVNELSQAVREVLRGQAYLTPLVTQNLADSLIHERHKKEPPVPLTERQQEVLALLVKGEKLRRS